MKRYHAAALALGFLLASSAAARAEEVVLAPAQPVAKVDAGGNKVPFLGDLPYLGRLFRHTAPIERSVPILGELPFLGRLFRIQEPPGKKVPYLSEIPILGELFIIRPNP